jgi:hypothetical protein
MTSLAQRSDPSNISCIPQNLMMVPFEQPWLLEDQKLPGLERLEQKHELRLFALRESVRRRFVNPPFPGRWVPDLLCVFEICAKTIDEPEPEPEEVDDEQSLEAPEIQPAIFYHADGCCSFSVDPYTDARCKSFLVLPPTEFEKRKHQKQHWDVLSD